jgi:hypothetical protein
MALKATQPTAVTRFSLEDVFVAGEADKLAWVSGWRRLPHVPREVLKLFEYPQQFAADVFDRIELALRRCVADGDTSGAVQNGRLFILAADDPRADFKTSPIPNLPVQYVTSSDAQFVAAHKAVACDEKQLLHSRLEGEFIVSYETSCGWVAITKDVLTEVLGAACDVKVLGLPNEAAQAVELMYPGVVVVADNLA